MYNRDARNKKWTAPFEIAGVAEGLVAKPERLAFSIEGPGGLLWRSPANNVTATGQLVSLRSTIDESFYRKVKDQPVTLRGYLYLTLYGNRRELKVPVNGAVRAVPGMGMCMAAGGPPAVDSLTCYQSLRPRAARALVTFEPHPRVLAGYTARFLLSYSPFPAELSIEPLVKAEAYSTCAGPLEAVTVSTEEPVAWVRAPLEIAGIRLAAYEATMK